MLALYRYVDYSKLLPNISVPVYIVSTNHDPFLIMKEARYMSEQIPLGKLVISKNGGHFIASDAQGEVIEIINQFLKTHESRDL